MRIISVKFSYNSASNLGMIFKFSSQKSILAAVT